MQGPGHRASFQNLVCLNTSTDDDTRKKTDYLQTGQWKMIIKK